MNGLVKIGSYVEFWLERVERVDVSQQEYGDVTVTRHFSWFNPHFGLLNPILGGYTTDNFWLNQILGGSMTVLMVKFIVL